MEIPIAFMVMGRSIEQTPRLGCSIGSAQFRSDRRPRSCDNGGIMSRSSGSMSGEWKRGTARLVRHRQTKGPGTDRPSLNNRATPRLYPSGGSDSNGEKTNDLPDDFARL